MPLNHPAGETVPRVMDPVFVDRTGRRRRLTIFAGVGMGVGLLTSLALILAGLFTGSTAPVPTWPEGGTGHGSDDGVVVDHLVSSPSGAPEGPTPSTAPTSRPRPTSTTSAAPTAKPGDPAQPSPTDDSRNGPGGRPSKSPNRPK